MPVHTAHPKAEQSARNAATVTGTAANCSLQIITDITVHNYDEHSPNYLIVTDPVSNHNHKFIIYDTRCPTPTKYYR